METKGNSSLGGIDNLVPTSQITVEELAMISGFIPIVSTSSTGESHVDIPGLRGKKIVDIGSGLTGFYSYLEQFSSSEDTVFVEVDPIFSNDLIRLQALNNCLEFYRELTLKFLSYRGEISTEEIQPYCVKVANAVKNINHSYNRGKTFNRGITLRRKSSIDEVKENSVDIVTVNHIFYASQEPIFFLQKLLYILKPDGKCLIVDYESAPNITKIIQCLGVENVLGRVRHHISIDISYNELEKLIIMLSRYTNKPQQ